MSNNNNGRRYVYRLLRENENPSYGLEGKYSRSNQTVWGHVRFGSKSKSHFISTSATYQSLRELVKQKTCGNLSEIRIVKIDLHEARTQNTDLKIYDLTDISERRKHIRPRDPAEKFARLYKEVLIVGRIHANAVSVIYKGPKDECPGSEALL